MRRDRAYRHEPDSRVPRDLRTLRGGARGFTLIEIVIALGLFLIVLFAVYSSFESSRATYAAGEQRADIQQNARIALELMTANLRLIGYGFPAGAPCDGVTGAISAAAATTIAFCADLTNASTIVMADVNPGNSVLSVGNAAGIAGGDTIYLMNGGSWEQRTIQAVNTAVTPHTITLTAPVGKTYPWGSQVGLPRTVTYCACDDPDGGGPQPWTCQVNANTICKNDGTGGGLQPLAGKIQNFQIQYFDATGTPTVNLADIRRMAVTIGVQSPPGWWRQQAFTIVSDIRPRNL